MVIINHPPPYTYTTTAKASMGFILISARLRLTSEHNSNPSPELEKTKNFAGPDLNQNFFAEKVRMILVAKRPKLM